MTQQTILHEIPPFKEGEFLYIADRHKARFDYPIHTHDILELNFVEHAAGAQRLVGDSLATIGDLDLVLIASPNLEHAWLQGDCQSADIHEVTLQFYLDDLTTGLLATNAFRSIRDMLDRARKGLAFDRQTIMRVYPLLADICKSEGYYAVRQLFDLLHQLSLGKGQTLATASFAHSDDKSDSRRIKKVKEYIDSNYNRELRLDDLSAMVGMVPGAFSRFFRRHTGQQLSEYVVEARLGHAARMLVDTAMQVSEIGYCCGYNTLSNFNRLFKKYRGCTPSEFRERYYKTKLVV